ncbi:MAG TPA: phosphodiester glycosidase family protein [Gaiellaceae bacterium]|nr:phosphodiester glycosidase family protein [Gaiellaceae bacterium]
MCAAVAVALVVPALAGAARQTLLPGVTYERTVVLKGGRPVVLHIVRTPPQGGLYRLRPVLSHGNVLGRQAVPEMQSRLRGTATTVGVNGDFFRLATGESSGLYLRDGVVSSPSAAKRSALAIGADGRLAIEMFRLVGSWRAGTSGARPLRNFNRKVTTPSGVALFTPRRGGLTPRARGAVEVVLTGFPPARIGADLTGTVAAVTRGGRTPIPRGGAVLQASGDIRDTLLAAAPVGTTVTIRLRFAAFPDGALDAIGGGPLLVRDGAPVRRPGEGFTFDQLDRRHPRTAVGQLADGSYLFVVADGRSRRSAGLTTWRLAQTMADLGAVTALNFDGGGSSTLSFDGRVLNTPSDGVPRRVANGLFLFYYGIYAPPLASGVLSPNGDGVGESKELSARVVRRAAVRLRLVRPDGSEAWRLEDVVGRGRISRAVSDADMPDGTWRWIAEATDEATGEKSRMVRQFKVNKTLGHLRLSRAPVRVRPPTAGRLDISVRLTRSARLTVAVLGTDGKVRRTVFAGEAAPGTKRWRWNARTGSGRVAPPGSYVVRVTARNEIGAVSLRRPVRVLLAPSR